MSCPFDMAEPDPVGFLRHVKGGSKENMALVAGGNAANCLACRQALDSRGDAFSSREPVSTSLENAMATIPAAARFTSSTHSRKMKHG
jgi:hypothetical protein